MVPETQAMITAALANPLGYKQQDATMTIAEGLDEYFRHIPNLIDTGSLEGSARELFTNHDIAHVVFGCDISLRQEVLMDTWTVFGTDVGLIAYARYLNTPEAQNLFKEIGYVRALWGAVLAIPDVFRVIVRARRMKKKWPWKDHEAYLNRSIGEVRRELGLVVVP